MLTYGMAADILAKNREKMRLSFCAGYYRHQQQRRCQKLKLAFVIAGTAPRTEQSLSLRHGI